MEILVLAHSLKLTSRRMNLSLLDLPRFIRDQGFSGLEVSDRQLAGLATNTLDRFSHECRVHRCGLIIDLNVDFTASGENLLAGEIAHAREMVRMAAELEARFMRICLGGQSLGVQEFFRRRRAKGASGTGLDSPKGSGSAAGAKIEKLLMLLGHRIRCALSARIRGGEGKLARAVSSLEEICPAIAASGIRMGIENHWGISGDPRSIVRIVEEVASPALGTCPDLGNFPRGIDREAALQMLAPHAVILHAKSYGFSADGEEKNIDYGRFLTIFRAAGFDGPITVEYEGLGDDLTGCRLTRDLVLRHWH